MRRVAMCYKTIALLFATAFIILLSPAIESKAGINDQIISKGQAQFDTAYKGELTTETFSYSITLPTSGKLSVNYTYGGDAGNSRFLVYDSAGNDLVYDRIGEGTHNCTVDLLAGDYEIRVGEYLYLNGDKPLTYSFIASFVPSNETVSESYLIRNDDVTTARELQLGTPIKGQFAVNDKTDVYKLNIAKNGFVNIDVLNEMKSLSIQFKSTLGDVSYDFSSEIGQHGNSYFCPAGSYYVICNSNNNTGIYTLTTSFSDIPSVTVKKVKNVKRKNMDVTFSRDEKAEGYDVQVAYTKNFKKGKKTISLTGNNLDKVRFSSLKKKTYYARVRLFVTDKNGKRYYSPWSKTKSVKIKK